jgi:hypothetical protein
VNYALGNRDNWAFDDDLRLHLHHLQMCDNCIFGVLADDDLNIYDGEDWIVYLVENDWDVVFVVADGAFWKKEERNFQKLNDWTFGAMISRKEKLSKTNCLWLYWMMMMEKRLFCIYFQTSIHYNYRKEASKVK